MWAGNVPLRCTAVPLECIWAVLGRGGPEALVLVEPQGLEGPGERMAVAPPTSIPASQPATREETPSLVQPSSMASRETESKARLVSQLEV